LRISPALPEEGERIFAIGNPLGLEWTVGDGIVSALRSIPKLGVAIQHAVPVSPGSSGCPLMNMRGEVVGLQSGIITTEKQVVQAGQNLNFAVPCDRIAALKPGALRTLAECAKQVPVAWKPAVLSGVDQAGLRFLVRNDFRAAIAFFEEAVKRSPREADAWFRLGLCNDRCGNTDKAIEAYKKAIFLDLQYAMAFNNLGVAYVRQGKNAEAVQVLQAAIRLKPDFALGFANLADALNNLKQHREAAEAARQAIRCNANLAPAHYHLGVACLRLGNRDGAKAEYEALLKLNDKALADKLKALLDRP
jgi:tetratricopeptide (TPR) repeat protein